MFFCACIFVLLLELENIYFFGKLLAKIFNFFSNMLLLVLNFFLN